MKMPRWCSLERKLENKVLFALGNYAPRIPQSIIRVPRRVEFIRPNNRHTSRRNWASPTNLFDQINRAVTNGFAPQASQRPFTKHGQVIRGQLIVPHPPTSREEIQEPFVRDQQINPKKYYPKGYHPELLEDWPVSGDLVVPVETLPENLKDSMGAAWRLREKNQAILKQQKK